MGTRNGEHILRLHGTGETHVKVTKLDRTNQSFEVRKLSKKEVRKSLEDIVNNPNAPSKARAKGKRFLYNDSSNHGNKYRPTSSTAWGWGLTKLTTLVTGERVDAMVQIYTTDPIGIPIADTYMWSDWSYSLNQGVENIILWDSGYFAFPRTETDLEPEPSHWYTKDVLDTYIDNYFSDDTRKYTGVSTWYQNMDFVLLPLSSLPSPGNIWYEWAEGWVYTIDPEDDDESNLYHHAFDSVSESGKLEWYLYYGWSGEADYMSLDGWWHGANVWVDREELNVDSSDLA